MNDKPNLVVIGGDTVAPGGPQDSTEYRARLHSILDFLIEEQIPWVSTGGTLHPNISPETMVQIETDYGRDLSWTGFKWNKKYLDEDNQVGAFTSRIPILDADGAEVFSIFVMDSNSWPDCGKGSHGTPCISVDAVSWFSE